MDSDDARRLAEQFLRSNPPGVPDAVLVSVREHAQAYVCLWTTARHVASTDLTDAQRLDAALHSAGLALAPAPGADGSWGF